MEPCTSNHEQIMSKLAQIEKRMDDDMVMIKSSYEDKLRRDGIWNVIKWVGFSGITALLVHLL